VNSDASEEMEEEGDDHRLDSPAARAHTPLPELPTEEHICTPVELPKKRESSCHRRKWTATKGRPALEGTGRGGREGPVLDGDGGGGRPLATKGWSHEKNCRGPP
jgi:hypothetical protein